MNAVRLASRTFCVCSFRHNRCLHVWCGDEHRERLCNIALGVVISLKRPASYSFESTRRSGLPEAELRHCGQPVLSLPREQAVTFSRSLLRNWQLPNCGPPPRNQDYPSTNNFETRTNNLLAIDFLVTRCVSKGQKRAKQGVHIPGSLYGLPFLSDWLMAILFNQRDNAANHAPVHFQRAIQ